MPALAGELLGLGRPCEVVFGRTSEFARIVAAELRRALITNFETGKGYGWDAALQESSRFDHPQVLLILQWRRTGH